MFSNTCAAASVSQAGPLRSVSMVGSLGGASDLTVDKVVSKLEGLGFREVSLLGGGRVA